MRLLIIPFMIFASVSEVSGSLVTTGPDGINSRALGLTGAGVSVGQVEPGRPGMPMKNEMPFDDAAWIHNQVQPANVSAGTTDGSANSAHVIYQTMPLHCARSKRRLNSR